MELVREERALLGDIGGTSARLVIKQGDRYEHAQTIDCAAHDSLEATIATYLKAIGIRSLARAAIAVAGPVKNGQAMLTNLGWKVSTSSLATSCGIENPKHVSLINDFEALALALDRLPAHELHWIGDVRTLSAGNLAVVGPGTGLGAAGLIRNDAGQSIPVVGEGGHMTASASNRREWQIIDHLHQQGAPHVSWERLISGTGLPSLHYAVCTIDGYKHETLSAEQIGVRAKEGSDASCAATTTVFSEMLGSFAGNVALTYGAIGGVFIAGGIVSKLGAAFDAKSFRARFVAKGRFEPYLAAIGTCIIQSTYPAFAGLSKLVER